MGLAVLCGLGAVLAVCVTALWIMCRAAACADRTYILSLSENREDIEWLLRRIARQWRWGLIDASQIVVVDNGLESDTADTVCRLCVGLGFEYILAKKE